MTRFLILCLAFLFLNAFAGNAQFLKVDNIIGESMVKDYVGWSEINEVTFGMGIPKGGATGQSRRRGTVKVGDIMVTKHIDKASPLLAEALTKGRVFPSATIVFETGGSPYVKYQLKNVMVTSYSFSGSNEDTPEETYSFNFEEIKVIYTEYDNTGDVKETVEYEYKVEEGH